MFPHAAHRCAEADAWLASSSCSTAACWFNLWALGATSRQRLRRAAEDAALELSCYQRQDLQPTGGVGGAGVSLGRLTRVLGGSLYLDCFGGQTAAWMVEGCKSLILGSLVFWAACVPPFPPAWLPACLLDV